MFQALQPTSSENNSAVKTIPPISSEYSCITSALPTSAPSVLSTITSSTIATSGTSTLASKPVAKPQTALQKALSTSVVAQQPNLEHVEDLPKDLRSHILKIKKQLQQEQQYQQKNQPIKQQNVQQQTQTQQTVEEIKPNQKDTVQPVKKSTFTTTGPSVPPPMYTSCAAGVITTTTNTATEAIQTSNESETFKIHDQLKTGVDATQQSESYETQSKPVPIQFESPTPSQPVSSHENTNTKPVPISSSPVMGMLKGIGANQMGSSRMVLVKGTSLLPDGRKPIMLLKQKGKIFIFSQDKVLSNEISIQLE